MFSNIHNLAKCKKILLLGISGEKAVKLGINHLRTSMKDNKNECDSPTKTTIINTSGAANTSPDKLEVEIIDINAEEMMNSDFVSDYTISKNPKNETPTVGVTAPVDIDPWADEEVKTEGTVEYEKVEAYKSEPLITPPTNNPPNERQGLYEYDGIKIWLPKKMFNVGSYRYRLDPKQKHLIADDMRICKFEKSSVDTKNKNE